MVVVGWCVTVDGAVVSTLRVLLGELRVLGLKGRFEDDDPLVLSLEKARERRVWWRAGFWNGSRASHAESNESDVDDGSFMNEACPSSNRGRENSSIARW